MIEIKDIKDPKFLKDVPIEDLPELATRIREFILEKVSVNGGHLSSNLGIVDLTLALCKVFDPSKDIFLFDVGHEAYTYKILTGRAKDFDTLRKKGGISGFQSIAESSYDKYEAGHSSTSLSTAMGMAIARDLDHKDYNIISIIGDGSFTNGLVYEALNHIGSSNNKQIIILNDNDMSISKNVGSFHNMLDEIRAGKRYTNTKYKTKRVLKKTKFGNGIYKFLDNIKDNLKRLYLKKSSIFTDLGLEYYGPINGHDYEEMLKYLEIAKKEDKSVILHVITEKGKGYEQAETDVVGKYHGIGAFDITTGEEEHKTNLPSFSEIVATDVYNLARKDKNIIVITPGMTYGSKLLTIKEKLPNQFIDVGIAEEHALLLANGLALNGKKPIVFMYSTFLQRGYDQIVHDIARMNSNVILIVDRAGLVPSDGVSHQGTFDFPMLMSIPNVKITSPKDAKEANDLIYTALETGGPFIIRIPKINIKYDYNRASYFKTGSWEVLKEGLDAFIISYGDFANKALSISEHLEEDGKHVAVINARFNKPYDEKLFGAIVKMNKPIYVYEENPKLGSLGSVLARDVQSYEYTSKMTCIGLNDEYLTHASRDELLEMTKLDENSVYKYIKKDLE